MLAFRSDPVLVRERHRVLHEADLDTADRVHLGANDPRRLFAAVVGIGANQGHRVDVGTAEAALPVLRRVRPDIAHGARTAPHPDAERLGEAFERRPGEPDRLQPLVGESDVDCETRAVLFLPRVDAVGHVAQPGARLRAVGELHEDVPSVAHEDGRDHVVLDIVKLVLQVSGGQTPPRTRVLMIALLPRRDRLRGLLHAQPLGNVGELLLVRDVGVDGGAAPHECVRLGQLGEERVDLVLEAAVAGGDRALELLRLLVPVGHLLDLAEVEARKGVVTRPGS